MPCRDGGPCCDFGDHMSVSQHREELSKLQEKLDYVTGMLCQLLSGIKNDNFIPDGSNFNEVLSYHPGLPKWWSDHQKKDSKRKAIEAAEAAVKRAMEDLKKLREE